ncbi:hypothetical protein [Epilithonimonas sp. UC225_85]|uniref:hypothetical protein n=1 Tax=Epilithonimonas sp. UC225_85 TaxID=3350167 RepID=UPI0036D2FE48
MITQNQRHFIIYLIPVIILTVVFIFTCISWEFSWTLSDFIIAGVILFGTAFIINLILDKIKTKEGRIILILMTLAIVSLIWIELAVGIFGSMFAGS